MAYILDTASNLRTLVYTIGVDGVANCDYNFTAPVNTTEQSIQLGGTTILPVYSELRSAVFLCEVGLSTGTGVVDVGTSSGGGQYIPGTANLDTTNNILGTNNMNIPLPSIVATSIWFSLTPSANWSTITTGKWKVWFTFIDNSQL